MDYLKLYTAVLSPSGIRDWFCGRQFLYRLEWGVVGIVSGWLKCIAFIMQLISIVITCDNAVMWVMGVAINTSVAALSLIHHSPPAGQPGS